MTEVTATEAAQDDAPPPVESNETQTAAEPEGEPSAPAPETDPEATTDDERPADVALRSGADLPAVIDIGHGHTVLLAEVVEAARREAGLSAAQWNELAPDDIEARLAKVVEFARKDCAAHYAALAEQEAAKDASVCVTVTAAPTSPVLRIGVNGKRYDFKLGEPTVVPKRVLPALAAAEGVTYSYTE